MQTNKLSIKISKTKNGNYIWVLISKNGQFICRSYSSCASLAGIYNSIECAKEFISHPSLQIIEDEKVGN
jgi:uncharacterized protein YegP (UPF0339 family)